MKQWHDLLLDAVSNGVVRPDRTGVGTWAVFGRQVRFNLQDGFPAVTTKELKFGQVFNELAAFIAGAHTLEGLHAHGVKIWDANIAETSGSIAKNLDPGDAGRIYGVQWRDWLSLEPPLTMAGEGMARHTDQLKDLVAGIKRDPYGRRHLVTAWNPGELDQMCLPPCHVLFQCFVRPEFGRELLDLRVDMRSVDLFLGFPFDVASYAALQHLLARETGLQVGELVFQLGDAHVYRNHQEQVRTVLGRTAYPPPNLRLSDRSDLWTFAGVDAELVGYTHHGPVPAPMNR